MQDENNSNSPLNGYDNNFRPPSRPVPRQQARPLNRENFIGGEIRQRPINRPSPPPSSTTSESLDLTPRHESTFSPPTNVPEPQRQTYSSPIDNDIETDIDDLFPIQATHNVNYEAKIKESLLAKKIPRLPKGIYVIIVANLVAVVISFFNTASTNHIYSVLMIIDLLAGVGLLFKNRNTRKAVVISSMVTIAVSLVLLDFFWLTSNNVNRTFTKNYNQIKLHSTQELPYSKRLALATSQAKIVTKKADISKASILFYSYTSVMVVESILVLVYLGRDGVKSFYIPVGSPVLPTSELLPSSNNDQYSLKR
jgi:hypothetical protein